MAFQPYNPGGGTGHSVLQKVIIANSAVVAVGEAVLTNSSGFVTNAAAAGPILGIVVGFSTPQDTPVLPAAYVPGTATGTDVQSVTAASDNQTVAKVAAIVDTSVLSRWSAAVNGTLGTTTASNQFGGKIDVDSANSNYARVLETTHTRTAATVANFFSWGPDPSDSTRLIVSICSSELLHKQG